MPNVQDIHSSTKQNKMSSQWRIAPIAKDTSQFMTGWGRNLILIMPKHLDIWTEHVMDCQKIHASSFHWQAQAKSSKLWVKTTWLSTHTFRNPQIYRCVNFCFFKTKTGNLMTSTENNHRLHFHNWDAGVPNLFPKVTKLPTFLHQVATELCISKEAAIN